MFLIKKIVLLGFVIAHLMMGAQYMPKNASRNLKEKAEQYADSIFQKLTLEEKIGQLYIVALYTNKGESHISQIRNLVEKEKIGGLILMQDDVEKHISLTNEFQQKSSIPLMIDQIPYNH